MKITKTEPTKGQFVAMWEHKGLLWSQNTRILNGKREVFIDHIDFASYALMGSSVYPQDTEITFYQL